RGGRRATGGGRPGGGRPRASLRRSAFRRPSGARLVTMAMSRVEHGPPGDVEREAVVFALLRERPCPDRLALVDEEITEWLEEADEERAAILDRAREEAAAIRMDAHERAEELRLAAE